MQMGGENAGWYGAAAEERGGSMTELTNTDTTGLPTAAHRYLANLGARAPFTSRTP